MRKFYLLVLTLLLNSALLANNEEKIKGIVQEWNELHNNGDIEKFKSLYASTVLFYGRYYSGQKCYEKKKAFLSPYFQQEIISPIEIRYYQSGTVQCIFTKRVTYKKKIKEHACYLLLEKRDKHYRITGESDLVTDANLHVKIDLGEEVTGTSANSKPLIITAIILAIAGLIFYKVKYKKNISNSWQAEESVIPPTYFESNNKVNGQSFGDEAVIVEKVKAAVLEEIKVNTAADVSENKSKGDVFEKFIVKKFKPEYFKLTEWRSDKYHEGIYASSNTLPDLEYNYQAKYTSLTFAIECKWRAEFIDRKIEWAKDSQLHNYRRYEREKRIPVFVIIGIGGQPSAPEHLYIVPLKDIYYNVLSESQLNRYYRHKKGDFYLNTNSMVLE